MHSFQKIDFSKLHKITFSNCSIASLSIACESLEFKKCFFHRKSTISARFVRIIDPINTNIDFLTECYCESLILKLPHKFTMINILETEMLKLIIDAISVQSLMDLLLKLPAVCYI